MAPTALAYTYCTQADVEQILSANGVSLRLDDSQNGTISAAEQLRMNDAINAATETCNYYCRYKYTEAQLATSTFINRAASWFAAYELCATRGNEVPESIINQAERWEEKLEAIQSEGKMVPGLPFRMSQSPTCDNTRVDARFQFKVIRVEKGCSTRTASQLPVVTDYAEAWSAGWDWMI